MTGLLDLHSALEALMQSAKSAKVSFYYLNDGDSKLRVGSIAVELGETCYVSFQELPPETALEQVARLRFAKITTLPSIHSRHEGDVIPALPMAVVLDALDPAKHLPSAPPVAAPAPVATEAAKQPHVFYSHLSMQKDALELLEPLFGVGAQKKLEEFARTSPPHQHPVDFLNKCRQHAAMMLGARKAEELFKPVFDKLSH